MYTARSTQLETTPVRSRSTLAGDSSRLEDVQVFCKVRASSVPLSTCVDCVRCATLPEQPIGPSASVTCWVDSLDQDAAPARRRGNVRDAREATLRTLVGEIMSRRLVMVRADTSIEALARLLVEHGLHAAPVVDADGLLVGMVSEADLVRAELGRDDAHESPPPELGSGYQVAELARATVGDVLEHRVHTLPENAPVSHAIGALATDGGQAVPVVSADGVIVGLVTMEDVMRWMAREIGYVIPEGPA